MGKLIEITDQYDLIETSKFPHCSFPFEKFNPIQSRLFDYYNNSNNVMISASTSSGKTVCSEMTFWHELKNRGGKCLYIGPQKALMQERIDDWSADKHPFSKLNLSICTGDYRFTSDRKEELENADIIIMTSEMWNSRIRGIRTNNEHWLSQVGTVVIDEFHKIRSPGRGDKLEVAIMKMAQVQPECKFVTLSATMPNAKEIGGWIAKLTNRDSYILESKYRPCPLFKHFIPYDDSHWKYQAKELAKISSAMTLIKRYTEDKFIVFAHSKTIGESMMMYLQKAKIETGFHNADLSTKKRVDLEHRFREDPNFRVLIATSTLSAGLNMPARRVIVLGPYCGLNEVEVDEIDQQCGRAGRPQYDKQGDAYILLPQSNMGKHILRIQNPPIIQSQLVKPNSGDFKTLAFHITNEIHQGNITTIQGIYDWYDKTFAAYQEKDLDSNLVSSMIDQLIKRGIIKQDGDVLEITPLGKVASLFYYSPFDVADLKRNFTILFDKKKELDETWLSIALSHIDSNRFAILTASEREQIEHFVKSITVEICVPFVGYKDFTDGVKKIAYCHKLILNGSNNVALARTIQSLKTDNDRLIEVLFALDNMVAQWNKAEYFRMLRQRMNYGVEWSLLGLCNIKGLGKVKSQKLWAANVRSIKDIVERPNLVKAVLGCSDKVLEKLLTEAKSLV